MKDGLVSDPEHCGFDPKVAMCKAKDGPDCLTPAQVETMRAVYGGVVNPRTGKQIFAGLRAGQRSAGRPVVAGPTPFPVATTYMRDLVFKDPKWDFKTFDYDKDIVTARKAGASVLDVPSDGLAKFFAGGGKLLLTHGWSDGLIPAGNTVGFYKSHDSTARRKDRAGTSPPVHDPRHGPLRRRRWAVRLRSLSVIDAWVKQGEAPERIVVSQPPGMPAMTRPLCPYPQVAKYTGKGSTDDAANFVCKAPKAK